MNRCITVNVSFVDQSHIAIKFELEMYSTVRDNEYRINIKWGTSR